MVVREKEGYCTHIYQGTVEVDNIHALVRIEGYEVTGDTPFDLLIDGQWRGGHRYHSQYGEVFLDDGGSSVILSGIETGRIEVDASQDYFHFIKVDDFFRDTSEWHTIKRMESYTWDQERMTLVLNLVSDDEDRRCAMLVQPATGSIARFRFHPGKKGEDYTDGNTRSVVLDSFSELVKHNLTSEFEVSVIEKTVADMQCVELIFHGSLVNQNIHVRAIFEPFSLEVIREMTNPESSETMEFLVMSTPKDGLRYRNGGAFNDYHIVQAVSKPFQAKYAGFGEQGGIALLKNNARITYFNYDNMRYRQVYNHGPLEEREPLYHSDPFFMEVNGQQSKKSCYGMFIDNPSETLLDMGYYDSTQYRFGIRYGDMDYYVMAGETCGDIIKSFSNVSGTARLIPRYALGYHQGSYGYENRRDIEEVAERYRKSGIPLDGIHIDVDIQKDYKTFTIDTDKFPNPKEMFSSLRAKGIKCSTNITPIISNRDTDSYATYREGCEQGYFVTDQRYDANNPEGRFYYKYASGSSYDSVFMDKEHNYNSGRPFIGEVYYGNNEYGQELGTTGSYPDLNRKEVREWWGRQYQYLFDMGLEMVWQDMTTPCLRDTRGDMLSFPSRLLVYNDYIKHPTKDISYEKIPVMKVWNLYSYNLHKATYHGLNNLKGRENQRNFIIGRGCFTGMQRFAGLWTGDNSSSWEFLRINISQVLALGLTGQALSGQDIGGFEQEKEWEKWADPELLIRWTAMGAFLPWFRNHYIRKGKKEFQEPYAYADQAEKVEPKLRDLYESVLPVSKYYIELRYTLLQLFYDAMFENTQNGMPICRALFLSNPSDMALFNDKSEFLNTEFMVRDELLVAPVLEKQAYENGFGKRDIYLPYGNAWYQFKNHKAALGQAIKGGTILSEFDASISNESHHIPYIVPLFVKEGAILPVSELEQYVGERNEKGLPNIMTLNIYPGSCGSYTMYLDDGVSRSSQPVGDENYGTDPAAKGEYRELKITHEVCCKTKTDNSTMCGQRRIVLEKVHDGYIPEYEEYMYIAILHTPEEQPEPVQQITVDNHPVTSLLAADKACNMESLAKMNENAWYYEVSNHTTYLKLFDEEDRKAHLEGRRKPSKESAKQVTIQVTF